MLTLFCSRDPLLQGRVYCLPCGRWALFYGSVFYKLGLIDVVIHVGVGWVFVRSLISAYLVLNT